MAEVHASTITWLPPDKSAPVGPTMLVVAEKTSLKRTLPYDGVLTVGRGSDADWRFESGSLSRKHARFIVTHGEVVVADIGSHNGTRVNGEAVNGSISISPGDVVALGEVTFVLLTDHVPRAVALLDATALRTQLESDVERAMDHGVKLTVLHLHGSESAIERAAQTLHESLLRSHVIGRLSPRDLAILLFAEDETCGRATAQHILSSATESQRTRIGMATLPRDGCDAPTLLAGARAAAGAAKEGCCASAEETAIEVALGDSIVVVADPATMRVYDLVRRLACTDFSVLVQGETGVGKENVAFALHHGSSRNKGPWIPINCAALPEQLVESELFGYEPGAFTDARGSKPGLLERAHQGTLFLDEIGDLPLSVQAKLLRVLANKKATRLGSQKERDVDVRFVAATNRNLEEEVSHKRFREDLFHRLNEATITIPPLRERPREIPILARRFLRLARARIGLSPATLSDSVLRRLGTYPFSGNVRELENAMKHAAATMNGEQVEIWDLPERIRRAVDDERSGNGESDRRQTTPPASPDNRPSAARVPLADHLRDLERSAITRALEDTGGHQARAAEILGMPLRTFVYKLRQYGMSARARKKRADSD